MGPTLNDPIDLDLFDEISRLKTKKDTVSRSHSHTYGYVNFIGDRLKLAQAAQKSVDLLIPFARPPYSPSNSYFRRSFARFISQIHDSAKTKVQRDLACVSANTIKTVEKTHLEWPQ
jgi:quinolinate synthase